MAFKKIKITNKYASSFALLYAFLLMIFSFDAFNSQYTLMEQLINFLIHIIPALIVVTTIWIAWQNSKYGGLLFIIIGVIFTVFFATYTTIVTFLIISAPPLLIGCSFIHSHYKIR